MIVAFRQSHVRCFTFHITDILFSFFVFAAKPPIRQRNKIRQCKRIHDLVVYMCLPFLFLFLLLLYVVSGYHKVVVHTFFSALCSFAETLLMCWQHMCFHSHGYCCVCVCTFLFAFGFFFLIVIKTARQLVLMFVSYWVLVFVSDRGGCDGSGGGDYHKHICIQ